MQLFEVVDTRRVDEGYFAHADDADFLLATLCAATDIIELVGYTKEVWAIDLIDLGEWWDLE